MSSSLLGIPVKHSFSLFFSHLYLLYKAVLVELLIKIPPTVFYLDTMENWDEKKLEEVVNKKHGEAEKKKAKTQIVSLS